MRCNEMAASYKKGQVLIERDMKKKELAEKPVSVLLSSQKLVKTARLSAAMCL